MGATLRGPMILREVGGVGAGRPPRPAPRSLRQYERTQPPLPLLKALLHSDWTGKLVPFIETLADAPWPDWIQAHLSPFSSPLWSSQPPFGNWSVIVSDIS